MLGLNKTFQYLEHRWDVWSWPGLFWSSISETTGRAVSLWTIKDANSPFSEICCFEMKTGHLSDSCRFFGGIRTFAQWRVLFLNFDILLRDLKFSLIDSVYHLATFVLFDLQMHTTLNWFPSFFLSCCFQLPHLSIPFYWVVLTHNGCQN